MKPEPRTNGRTDDACHHPMQQNTTALVHTIRQLHNETRHDTPEERIAKEAAAAPTPRTTDPTLRTNYTCRTQLFKKKKPVKPIAIRNNAV
mmetsp:Transcript_26987/g.57785  ORF Transcript_26987/g.57785 Transcript_26987/m.57785 type:complete len:91 (+) Transcript_26987:709-981(+)